MACGLPVIVTDSGDNRKWIKNDENGYVVPQKNPQALANKILLLLKQPDLKRSFGIKNRLLIEKSYNYYTEMEKAERLYEMIIEKSKQTK